jgi:hypothetical protein
MAGAESKLIRLVTGKEAEEVEVLYGPRSSPTINCMCIPCDMDTYTLTGGVLDCLLKVLDISRSFVR